GMLRAQGLAVMFAQVARTWISDDDEGLARTMAALDRALARGQHMSGLLDDAFWLATAPCRVRSRRRHRRDRDERGDEAVATSGRGGGIRSAVRQRDNYDR